MRDGDLRHLGQIENRVEDRVLVSEIDDWPIREYAIHALGERLVVAFAEQAVAEEKAAAQQVLAELRRLLVGELHGTGEPGDEKRPVESIVAVLEIDGLLDGAHMRACEAL